MENWNSKKPHKKSKALSSSELTLRDFYGLICSKLSVISLINNFGMWQKTVETKNQHLLQNIQLMVLFSRKQEHRLLSKIKKQLKRTLPEDFKTMITYKSTKLSTKFPVKSKIDFKHKKNVFHHSKCSNEGCKDDYVGETNRLIVERIKHHLTSETKISTYKPCPLKRSDPWLGK